MKKKIKEGEIEIGADTGHWTLVWSRKTRKRKRKKRNETCMDENEMKERKII